MTDSEFRNYAKQSGLGQLLDCDGVDGCLEHFANLVAQHERKACSSIASDYAQRLNSMTAVNIADAIRARGQS